MNDDKHIEIEKQMLEPDFYLRDFSDDRAAADFLGITQTEWTQVIGPFEESLHSFIYTIRVEKVKQHLEQNPREPLRKLISLYHFHSVWHLLWHFYRRERCTPRGWAACNGLLL